MVGFARSRQQRPDEVIRIEMNHALRLSPNAIRSSRNSRRYSSARCGVRRDSFCKRLNASLGVNFPEFKVGEGAGRNSTMSFPWRIWICSPASASSTHRPKPFVASSTVNVVTPILYTNRRSEPRVQFAIGGRSKPECSRVFLNDFSRKSCQKTSGKDVKDIFMKK